MVASILDQKQVVISWPASNAMGPIHSACREVSDVASLKNQPPSFILKGRSWVQPRPSQGLANSASFWSLFSNQENGDRWKVSTTKPQKCWTKVKIVQFLKDHLGSNVQFGMIGWPVSFQISCFLLFFLPFVPCTSFKGSHDTFPVTYCGFLTCMGQ